jgi:hypothetical protein
MSARLIISQSLVFNTRLGASKGDGDKCQGPAGVAACMLLCATQHQSTVLHEVPRAIVCYT